MKNVVKFPTIGLKGRYKIEAVDGLTGKRRLLADWFDNLITDSGLNTIGTTINFLGSCFVGSGNTAPANSDTSLVSLVGSTTAVTTTSSTNTGSSPYIGTMTKTYRFAIGVATGNLSEVGAGPTATTLFSRALILDGGGSPTTITVLSSEALDVTYQLQQYVPLVDVTGTVVISGTSYAYTLRAANATSTFRWAMNSNGDQGGPEALTVFNGAIGAITSAPSGTSASGGSAAPQAYSAGTHQKDTIFSMGLTDGNVSGGISALEFLCGTVASMGDFQVGLSPAIPKDASHTLTLTLRHSWARH